MKQYLDSLTGLNNIIYLFDNYDHYRGNRDNVHMIAFNIKKLKKINDEYDRKTGDDCLLKFSEIIKNRFIDSLIVRVFGDKFVVVTDDDATIIQNKIEGINSDIINLFNACKLPINFAFHAGIKECDSDIKDILFKANITMEKAGHSNELLDWYNNEAVDKLVMEETFLQKINGFFDEEGIRYQMTNVYNGLENVKFKEVSLVNNSFLILSDNLELDEKIKLSQLDFLLQKIMLELRDGNNFMLSIDSKTLILPELNFIGYMDRNISKLNIEPSSVCLNIKVNVSDDQLSQLINKIAKLKEMGFLICLDRISLSGQESLFPIISMTEVDYVKIDRKILVKAMNEQRLNKVLGHLSNMLRELEIYPIFEGVTNESELKFINNFNEESLYYSF